MNIQNISIALMVGSVLASVATFVYLKYQKTMVEKAFVYGIIASLVAQLLSSLMLIDSSIGSMIFNATFLSMVFYNVVAIFGIRSARIYESSNLFISYFAGMGIVGNILNLLLYGIMGYTVNVYAQSPELVEMLGADVIEVLIETIYATLGENLPVLLVSLACAIVISYVALSLFTISFKKKVLKTNFKSMLILFVYYLVTVFMPSTDMQVTLQAGLYVITTIAAFWIYLQSKNDEPSIKIIVQ